MSKSHSHLSWASAQKVRNKPFVSANITQSTMMMNYDVTKGSHNKQFRHNKASTLYSSYSKQVYIWFEKGYFFGLLQVKTRISVGGCKQDCFQDKWPWKANWPNETFEDINWTMCFPCRCEWPLDSAALNSCTVLPVFSIIVITHQKGTFTNAVHCCWGTKARATPQSDVISQYKHSLQNIKGKCVRWKDAKDQLTNCTWIWNGINPWKCWSKAGNEELAGWGFWVRCVMLLAGKYGSFLRVSVKLCCESSGTRPSRGWKMGEQQPSRMKVRH